MASMARVSYGIKMDGKIYVRIVQRKKKNQPTNQPTKTSIDSIVTLYQQL